MLCCNRCTKKIPLKFVVAGWCQCVDWDRWLEFLRIQRLMVIMINFQATTDSYTTSSLAWHLVPISLCNMILAAMNSQSTWKIVLSAPADMFRCTTMQQLLLLLLPSPPPLSDHNWLPFFLPQVAILHSPRSLLLPTFSQPDGIFYTHIILLFSL